MPGMVDKRAVESSTRAMKLVLVVGSRNLSSWSLRPWLALRQGGVPFDEEVVPLDRPDTAQRIARWSPSGRLPVLVVDDVPVWDSLAICELAAELAPDLWPAEPMVRAHARSVSAEMHAGFADLRRFMPMDFVARFGAPGRLLTGVVRDVARIEAIWIDCRERHAAGGPFLFGRFSIADAMFAPVVSRFVTYDVALDAPARAYVETMLGLPAWTEWAAAAQAEIEAAPVQPAPRHPDGRPQRTPPGIAPAAAPPSMDGVQDNAFSVRPRLSGDALGRVRLPRTAEVKPIGDGIHRRR